MVGTQTKRVIGRPRLKRGIRGTYAPKAKEEKKEPRKAKVDVGPALAVQFAGTKEWVIDKPIAEIVSVSRFGLGWSVKDLADKANVHPSTVHRAENDMNEKGSWGWMRCRIAILAALGYSVTATKKGK